MKRFLICLFSLLIPVAIEAAAATATPYIVNKQGRGTNVALVTSTNEGVFTVTGPAGTGGAMSNNVSMTIASPITYASAVATRTNPVNVAYYGAKGDGGVTDNLLALQTAFRVAATNRASVFIPAGTYWVSGSLEMTNAWSVKIFGESGLYGKTILCGGSNGYPMLDLSGANRVTMQDITIDAQKAGPYRLPSCALLLGRRVDSASSQLHRFNNVHIGGDYTVASVYSLSSEIQHWVDGAFEAINTTNPHALFWWGRFPTNLFGTITSLYQDVSGVTGINGNSLLNFDNCVWGTASATPDTILLGADSFQGITIKGGYMATDGPTNMVVLEDTYETSSRWPNQNLTIKDFRFEFTCTNTPRIWFKGTNTFANISIENSRIVPIYADDNSWLQDVKISGSAWSTYLAAQQYVFDVGNLLDSRLLMSDTNLLSDGRHCINGLYRVRTSSRGNEISGVAPWQHSGFLASATDGRKHLFGATDVQVGNTLSAEKIGVKTTAPVGDLEVRGAYLAPLTRYNGGNLTLWTTNDFAAGTGAALMLGGKADATDNLYGFAGIGGIKSDSSSGSIDGILQFYTSLAGTGTRTNMEILANGNVGIGVFPPSFKLDVAGNINSSADIYAASQLYAGTRLLVGINSSSYESHLAKAGALNLVLEDTSQSSGNKIWDIANSSTALNFWPINAGGGAASLPLTLLRSGNVGINTNNPQAALHVVGTVQIDQATNSTGTDVKGQLPIIVNGVTYYIDLKK